MLIDPADIILEPVDGSITASGLNLEDHWLEMRRAPDSPLPPMLGSQKALPGDKSIGRGMSRIYSHSFEAEPYRYFIPQLSNADFL